MYSDARAYSYITAKRDYEFIYIVLLLIYFNKWLSLSREIREVRKDIENQFVKHVHYCSFRKGMVKGSYIIFRLDRDENFGNSGIVFTCT